MGEMSQELRSTVDFLRYSEDAEGERAVASISALTNSASRLRGSRAQELRQVIDRYNEVLPLARGKADRVAAAGNRVIAAVSRVHQVTTDGQLLTARREEQTAQQTVTDIRSRQQTAEGWADQVFDATVGILTGGWKDALKDLGKFAGRELIVHNLVGAYFEEELTQAETRLATIRNRISSLEDEQQLAVVRGAIADLNAAQQELRAETRELPSLARQAETAHEDLYRVLNRMGVAGQDAASALDGRLAVIQSATFAEDLAHQYEDRLNQVQESAQTLQNSYSMYAEFLGSPGGENAVPDNFVRIELRSRAASNTRTCDSLVSWIAQEQPRLDRVRSYIQGGSYMRSFDDGIEGALHEVRMSMRS